MTYLAITQSWRWWFRRPFGFVPRAYLKQIDAERAAWKRWCEDAERLNGQEKAGDNAR